MVILPGRPCIPRQIGNKAEAKGFRYFGKFEFVKEAFKPPLIFAVCFYASESEGELNK